MKTFFEYVTAYRTLKEEGKRLSAPVARVAPPLAAGGPVVLLFSPHPDDECITGGLALRLRREAGARVVNVPVTFGSRPERRAARRAELTNACAHLGFELADPPPEGFQTPEEIARVLDAYRPRLIFFPHAGDWNRTHERVHRLVMDALPLSGVNCLLAETEFWHPMKNPNLMAELSAEDLSALVEALAMHAGEVARNPYHLTLPAWMMDNVRRGSELVPGQGAAAPGFAFAALYRLSRCTPGGLEPAYAGGRMLAAGECAGNLTAL